MSFIHRGFFLDFMDQLFYNKCNRSKIWYALTRHSYGEKDMADAVTGDEFKTIMEMVRMIVESAKDKEEALKKSTA